MYSSKETKYNYYMYNASSITQVENGQQILHLFLSRLCHCILLIQKKKKKKKEKGKGYLLISNKFAKFS